MATAAGSRERSRSRENLRDIAAARIAAAQAAALSVPTTAGEQVASAGLQFSQAGALQTGGLLQPDVLQQLAALQQPPALQQDALQAQQLQSQTLDPVQQLLGQALSPALQQSQLDPAIMQLLAQQHQLDPAVLQLLASQQADPLLAQGLQQPQLDQAALQAADQQKALHQISMQQQMLKQAEDEAKQQAAKAGGYVGILARFDDIKGYGFIECSESRAQYGRDIFLLKSKKNDSEVGDMVSFTVEMGDQGKPQATNVTRLSELSQHKKMILTWQQMYTGAMVDASSGVPVMGTVREFTGVVGKWDAEKGWGFIECTETYALYQRNVFIHKDHWIPGMRVGDVVGFHVELNNKGWPQARNVSQKQVLGGALAPGGGAFVGIGHGLGTHPGLLAGSLPASASLSASGGLAALPAPPTASAVSSAAPAQQGLLSVMIGQDPALTVEDQTCLMAFFGRLSVTSVTEIQELGKVTNLQELIGKELYAHELGTPMSMPAKTALGRILLKATGAG